MNTDLVKAMQKIAELVQNERLEQHDIPHLLVTESPTCIMNPLQPPNIIFWNVLVDTFGYKAEDDQKSVLLL
jgi:hypothetical protein